MKTIFVIIVLSVATTVWTIAAMLTDDKTIRNVYETRSAIYGVGLMIVSALASPGKK